MAMPTKTQDAPKATTPNGTLNKPKPKEIAARPKTCNTVAITKLLETEELRHNWFLNWKCRSTKSNNTSNCRVNLSWRIAMLFNYAWP